MILSLRLKRFTAAGTALGPTGFDRLDATQPVFSFLADIGFALVMFVAGTQVPVTDPDDTLTTAKWSPVLGENEGSVAMASVPSRTA